MALIKDDRIAFSKKMVETPFLISAINRSKEAILAEKDKAYKLDQAHKNLVDGKTAIIDALQPELNMLDGNLRNNLTEADIQDSGNFVLGNLLYPNDPNNPPPSTAPMIWTKTKPYARNKAIGKQFNETYATTTKEGDIISSIQSQISTIQSSFVLMEQVTGQECTTTAGSCSLPAFTNQVDCTTNGGIWTPGSDIIQNSTGMQAAMTNLISDVNSLKSFLQSEALVIYATDADPTRQATATAALNNINNVIIPAIDTWLALNSFNTSHGQTTCSGFYSYNASSLGPTKLQTSEINALLGALSTRTSFISTRISQLNGYLGSVTQDLSTGDVTGSGLYFERWSFIQLRLNMLGGSLIALLGYERALVAQDEQIANLNSAKATYEIILRCSAFSAPGNGTKFVHVKSSSGFLVGDNVFVMADNQEELLRTVEAIDGNRITLGAPVPANYRDSSFARIYKDIS